MRPLSSLPNRSVSTSMNQRRCVIADDLRASRTLLQTWLEPCGYACEAAVNGEEAWNAILRSPPCLVVTDIEMPRASGLDLLCSIRQHSSSEIRAIPVIVISSLIDDNVRQYIRELGGTFFMPKPLNKDETQRIVNHLSDQRVLNNLTDLVSELRLGEPKRISPTLQRLYRDVQKRSPKFS